MKDLHIYNVEDCKIDGLWLKSYGKTVGGQKYRCTTRAGKLWAGIHTRLSTTFKEKNPSYLNKVNDFSDFQSFAEWCQSQFGYLNTTENGRHWHLDKDILDPDAIGYGEGNCIFVPEYINTLFSWRKTFEQQYSIGICRRGPGKRMTQEYSRPFVTRGFDIERLSDRTFYFETEQEAHRKWQECKMQKLRHLIDTDKSIADHSKLIIGLQRIEAILLDDLKNNRATQR